jgi:hypothetical protein
VTDGKKFHQYQQRGKKTSPEHTKSMIHGAGRPGSNLGHAQKGDKIKPIHGISFPSDN